MIALATLCLAVALGLALVLLLIARALGWRRRRIAAIVRPWLLAIWILLTLGLSMTLAEGPTKPDTLGWALVGGWLAVSLAVHFVDRRRGKPLHPSRMWGSRLAHAGVGIAVGGMILSYVLSNRAQRLMEPGETTIFNGWTVQLHEVWPAAGEGWTGVAAELRATSGRGVILLEPELRSAANRSVASTPAKTGSGSGMLSASIGARDSNGEWPVELGWTPMLVLISLGGTIAAIGGMAAMVGPSIARWRRLRRARLATAWWA